MKDRRTRPMDDAVWLVEYVARTKGAEHLKVNSRHLGGNIQKKANRPKTMFFYRNAGVLFRGRSCNPRHPPGAHHLQPLPPPPPSSESLLRLEKDESSLKQRQTVKSDKTTDWKSSMTFSYLLIYRGIDFTYYDSARIAKAVQSHSYFHQYYNSIPNCWQSPNWFSLSFCVPLACSFSFLVRSGVRGQSSLLWLLFLPDQWTMLLVELSASVKKGSYSLASGCPRNKKG